jgi:RsmE family RNA methyltransferase
MRDVKFPEGANGKNMLVAVGPEGGWEEPEELDRFRELGFQQITLGTRVLRSDVAVVSLLSLANDLCESP